MTIEIVFLRSFNETVFNAISGLVGTIIGLIKKFELDTQTIRARLVNNLEEYTGRYSFYE
ncbi:MAG: hypothetical protein OEY31_13215 [Candidatus Bathyarchaeota archaeon]|nr:hypothetical protein [Candidatus Bathyarchaeota archaeon]